MSFHDAIIIGSGTGRLTITVELEFGPLTEAQVKEIQTIVELNRQENLVSKILL